MKMEGSLARWALLAVCLSILVAASTANVIDIPAITGTNGFVIQQGGSASDNTGFSMAYGDFDGDGYGDVLIGAPLHNKAALAEVGRVYFVFGRSTPFTALDLSQDPPIDVSFVNGLEEGDNLGYTVAAGDINNDGISDAVLCAPSNGAAASEGACTVIFGSARRASIPMNLSAIDGTNGFVITSLLSDSSTEFIANWGVAAVVADINGDGFNDVCISSSGDANIEGRVACIYGRSGGYSSRGYNFGSLKGNVGFQIIGRPADKLGSSLAAGDITNDGCIDLIIGAPTYTSPFRPSVFEGGAVYVILGRCDASGFPEIVLADDDLEEVTGFLIEGAETDDNFGQVVRAADINGDTVADIVVTAPFRDGDGVIGTGAVSIFFGGRGSGSYVAHAGLLTDPSEGVTLYGLQSQNLGYSADVGDFNGDGVMDVAVGTGTARYNSLQRSGMAVVLYGQCSFNKATWLVSEVAASEGSLGFQVVNSVTARLGLGYSIQKANLFNRPSDGLILATGPGLNSYYLAGRTSVSSLACPVILPSPSPSASSTRLPSSTVAVSTSPSPSRVSPTTTPSITPSISVTPSITPSISVTPSITPSISVTPSITPSISVTPSITPSISVTPSITPSISVTPSITPTISVTPSITPTISRTPSTTPSAPPTPSNSPSPSTTPSNSPYPFDIITLTNGEPRDTIITDYRGQVFRAFVPVGVSTFNVSLDIDNGGQTTEPRVCLYTRREQIPNTADYDSYRCSSTVSIEVENTLLAKRGVVVEDGCTYVTYYFFVTGSVPRTNFTILFKYDPGCDNCGGFEDSCGCHPAGSTSPCSCAGASYRGYDASGLDRSLLLSEVQLLRQYVEQTQALAEEIQTRFAATDDTTTESEFDDIIDETFHYQSLLDDFNPFIEGVRTELVV